MPTPIILSPCPFCGSSNVWVSNHQCVRCPCGASGPNATQLEDAPTLWNKRIKQPSESHPHGHIDEDLR